MGQDEQEYVVDDEDRALLRELLEAYRSGPALPEIAKFRAAHRDARPRLDKLVEAGFIELMGDRYGLTPRGLFACDSQEAREAYQRGRELFADLLAAYAEEPSKQWNIQGLSARARRPPFEVARILTLLRGFIPWVQLSSDPTGFIQDIRFAENILDTSLPAWPEGFGEGVDAAPEMQAPAFIDRIEISGYRPFSGFEATPGRLTVIIGANASGKSSLFDALRLLSHAAEAPLPPEIDPRIGANAALFHAGGPERIELAIVTSTQSGKRHRYEVSIMGPVGSPRVHREKLVTVSPNDSAPFAFLDFTGGKGIVRPSEGAPRTPAWTLPPNQLALRGARGPAFRVPAAFQEFVSSWRFYSGFDVSPTAAVRRPAHIEENPVLAEDGSNLSAVLNSLILEHRDAWEELEMSLRAVIPGFESLSVRPRGARGMAIGIWRERGVADELTLSDLSEGTLRLLCWLALAFSPNLSPVICIDEPELGLHPRVLPMLAGAFKLASARSQILIATHSPHFLSQFDLEDIAVMRKEDGRATFVRPATSQALVEEVKEIGGAAIARLFLSEELEVLP